MKQLSSFLTQSGAQTFLDETQTPLALIAADGSLLEWNQAFERLDPDIVARSLAVGLEKSATRPRVRRNLHLELPGWPDECGFSRLLIPLPGGLSLLCLEMNWEAQKTAFLRLKQRLGETEKALVLKQIDLESVLVQADEVSHTDPLTFLPNRKQIIADLQREVQANRQTPAPLTIFMLDFDHFKRVNDAYGHAAGDQVLRSLANQLQANIRQSDKLGRYGGEEFLALLPATGLERAIQLAKRLLKVAHQCRVAVGNGQFAQVTISIGIAQHHSGVENWEELLKRADQALYTSKNRGRDQWSVAEFNHLQLED